MQDLKLFTYGSNAKLNNRIDTAKLTEGLVTQSAVTGLELIVGKVVKYLLTEKGTDLFDPEYGSIWVGTAQISETYLPRFQMVVESDLRQCLSYITIQENSLPVSTERLKSVEFVQFIKDTSTGTEQILVSIRVRTTLNNVAVFDLSGR